MENDLPDESEVEKIKDKTILIIEDDLTSYNYLEEILTPLIPRIIRATDGQKAIEIFKNETIDLVLMDIHLPGLDGYAATKPLKKLKPHVPIIAQTANAMNADKTMALKAGCNDYVSKPIDSKVLIRKIIDNI